MKLPILAKLIILLGIVGSLSESWRGFINYDGIDLATGISGAIIFWDCYRLKSWSLTAVTILLVIKMFIAGRLILRYYHGWQYPGDYYGWDYVRPIWGSGLDCLTETQLFLAYLALISVNGLIIFYFKTSSKIEELFYGRHGLIGRE